MTGLKARLTTDVDTMAPLDTETALTILNHLHTRINTLSTSLMYLHTHLRYLIRISDLPPPTSYPSRGRLRFRPPPPLTPHPIASSPKRFSQASSLLTNIHLTLNKLEDLTARLRDHENETVQCERRIAECFGCCEGTGREVEEAGREARVVVGECIRFVGGWERELRLGVV